ncbi:MAG: hypothetical protein AAF215_20060 [Cyanobacteria bacterium P01_A01_bin.123]
MSRENSKNTEKSDSECKREIFNELDATIGIQSIWGVYGYTYGGNDMVSSHFEALGIFLNRVLDSGLATSKFHREEIDVHSILNTEQEIRNIIQANKKADELFLAALRQEMLFVDHIYVPDIEYSTLLNEGIEELSTLHDEGIIKLATLGDVDQSEYSLQDDGILRVTSTFSMDGHELYEAVQKADDEMMDYQYCLMMLLLGLSEENIRTEYRNERKKEIFRNMKSWGIPRATKEYLNAGSLMHDLQTRLWCQLAFDRYGVMPIPLVNTFSQYDKLPKKIKGKQVGYQDVVHLVLKQIPMPSLEMPLDEFIDFRRSAEHRNSFYSLKRWMRKIGKSNITLIELEEELEYLISEYESFMRLQKLKIETGAFQTILTTGGDIVENIIKLNFSKAAKGAFDLKRRKIALMEVEKEAPGREVSYIVNSQEKLIDDL